MSRPAHFLRPLLRASSQSCRLFVDGREEPLADHLETAFDSASRKRGLLGRRSMAAGHALIIAPCSLVHTFGMTFAIDVVYASRDGRVIKVRRRIGPRRVSGALRAFATIELAAGAASDVSVGARLEVR